MATDEQPPVPIWGDANKAAGNFGTVEKSPDTRAAAPGAIPVIDVSPMFSPMIEDRKRVAAELREACLKIGFFYVKGHGIDQAQIDRVFEGGKQFFSLGFEEKMEIFINNTHNYRGFTPLGGSGARLNGKGIVRVMLDRGHAADHRLDPDMNEAFDWGHDRFLNDDPTDPCTDPYMRGDNVWPRQLPEFKEELSAYYRTMRAFCRIMARNVALSLDLEEDYFAPFVTHPVFTILAPGDVPALEVLNRDGYWISAPPINGCFIVNVGDQLQRMTNNLYISTKHRVMNYSGKERYSVPFFFSVNWETVIEPIQELLQEGDSAEAANVTAGQMYKDTMVGFHLIAESDPVLRPWIKELRAGRR
ncbi:hypothetical protein BP6252_08887 [Coleophoma cylindrospora]|uniref:Fe2OG dioxygenase domain-containing protein n=1 Tax=Coleophoma cylindrospora TaxID=1849047 RepID=A0A3D8R778_9HELO|nr:hypothetical protein BP6252_08887 [Coleophoma cylindrospora]